VTRTGSPTLQTDLLCAATTGKIDQSKTAQIGGYRVQGHVELSPSVTKRPCPSRSFAGNSLTVNREQ